MSPAAEERQLVPRSRWSGVGAPAAWPKRPKHASSARGPHSPDPVLGPPRAGRVARPALGEPRCGVAARGDPRPGSAAGSGRTTGFCAGREEGTGGVRPGKGLRPGWRGAMTPVPRSSACHHPGTRLPSRSFSAGISLAPAQRSPRPPTAIPRSRLPTGAQPIPTSVCAFGSPSAWDKLHPACLECQENGVRNHTV